jgi:hypothetical protein
MRSMVDDKDNVAKDSDILQHLPGAHLPQHVA